jgi:hypothetical protein
MKHDLKTDNWRTTWHEVPRTPQAVDRIESRLG